VPSLREIRHRLRAVGNIQQITTAMEMVASARLRKAQTKAEQARPYIRQIRQILEKVSSATGNFSHPFFQHREVTKTAVVIVAGDRGLCGPYNSNVFNAADRFLSPYTHDQVELILIGQKAIDYYRLKKWPIGETIAHWGGKISFAEIKDFASTLIHRFSIHELDEIWLVYTQFQNLLHREVRVEKFLNIERPKETNENTAYALDYIYDPNIEEIYAQILPRYCMAKMETVLDEAYASELAARIFSMKAASKNAEEMIEDLTLLHNKTRQANITKEMLEITSNLHT